MTKQRLLQLAHKGLLMELEEIQKELLADSQPVKPTKPTPGKAKRVLSPEARERIAQAQRKRWRKAKKANQSTNDSSANPVEA